MSDLAKQKGPPEKDAEPRCLLTKDVGPERSSLFRLGVRTHIPIFLSRERSGCAQHES